MAFHAAPSVTRPSLHRDRSCPTGPYKQGAGSDGLTHADGRRERAHHSMNVARHEHIVPESGESPPTGNRAAVPPVGGSPCALISKDPAGEFWSEAWGIALGGGA